MYTASHRPSTDDGLPSSPPLSPYQSPSGGKRKKKVNRNGGSSNHQAGSTAMMRSMPTAKGVRGSISGKPMYETDGKEDKLCSCTDSAVNAQFHPQAVVVRTRKKVCCFPSAKSMFVLPRYKITDIQTGAGRKDVPGCLYLVLSAAILLIVFGAMSSLWSTCDTTSNTSSSSLSISESGSFATLESCGISGVGIFMIIAGCLLFLAAVGLIANYCRGKDHWYVLEYSDNRQSNVTVWIFVVPVASISLLAVGANMTECSSSSSSSSSSSNSSYSPTCYLTGGGIAMVAIGALLALVSIFLFVNQFCSKGKGSGSSGGGTVSRSGGQLYLASEEKPNEEFLYNYVYDSVEQTIDLPFLHRFNHLNRAGLMEAVAERNTPDELRTMVSSSSNESSNIRYSIAAQSVTSATDRDTEMAF